jgi:streptogramin lyase
LFPISAQARAIVKGADGNLWFTEFGAPDKIGRLNPSGALAEFPLATTRDIWGLAAGGDGNVWFIGIRSAQVGRITPDGTITEFPLPAGTESDAIATGPDGDVWIEGSGGFLRVASDGSVTKLATNIGSPYRYFTLSAGPGGQLWFGTSPGSIGHISTSGAVSYSSLSAVPGMGGQSQVFSEAEGRDGDLWFLATGTSGGVVLGHVAADGTISALPTQVDGFTMTVGPDGNLWITDIISYGAPKVERVTPSGSAAAFTVPIHRNPKRDDGLATFGITTGPDGNLWITESPFYYGPGATGPFEVVHLLVAQSTPDGTRSQHKSKHPKPAHHLKPTHPGDGHKNARASSHR